MTSKIEDFKRELEQMIEDVLGQTETGSSSEQYSLFDANRQVSVSSQASGRIQARDLQSLNESELKSIYALLAYVSHNENIQQETVQAIVEARFNVNHIAKIAHRDYDEAIRFLVDLRIDEMRN